MTKLLRISVVLALIATVIQLPFSRAFAEDVVVEETYTATAPVPFPYLYGKPPASDDGDCLNYGLEDLHKHTHHFVAPTEGYFEATTEVFDPLITEWDLFLVSADGSILDFSVVDNPERVGLYLNVGDEVDVVVCNVLVVNAPVDPNVDVTLRMPVACIPDPTGEYGSVGEPRGAFPNDPLFDRQWGLQTINAVEAWDQGATGEGATIAVVDSGVDLEHPDLIPNLTTGIDVLGAGSDDCSAAPDDGGTHGTMVAGIAAAEADNGIGLAGVAPDASIMPIRARGSTAFHQSPREVQAAADGIRWAADHGADVINMSFGRNVLLQDDGEVPEALAYAWAKGVVLIAAAGNLGLSHDAPPTCEYLSPANQPNVICVGGITKDQVGDSQSLVGPWYSHLPMKAGGVGVRAPSGAGADVGGCPEEITSTLPGGKSSCGLPLGYGAGAGTSMATPHVAGIAALLSGRGLDNHQIVDCIKTTSINPVTGKRGENDPYYGYGIVDAAFAVEDCTEPLSDNIAPLAELRVTPDQLKGNGEINIHAEVSDLDGTENIVSIELTITDAHEKIVDTWTGEDFTIDDGRYVFDLTEYRLNGASPWTFSLLAWDSAGLQASDEATVSRGP